MPYTDTKAPDKCPEVANVVNDVSTPEFAKKRGNQHKRHDDQHYKYEKKDSVDGIDNLKKFQQELHG